MCRLLPPSPSPYPTSPLYAPIGARARVLQILSELVSLWFQGEDIFLGPDAWFTWATLLGWLFFVGVWLYRMNEALSLCVSRVGNRADH